MKKVLVVMAMVMGVGCMSAIAAETSVDSVACCQSTQDEYTKVEVADVPEVVKTAVEKSLCRPDHQRSLCSRKKTEPRLINLLSLQPKVRKAQLPSMTKAKK